MHGQNHFIFTRYVVYPASFSMDTDSTAAGVNLAIQYTSAEAMNEWSYSSTPSPTTRLCGVHSAPLPMHVGLLLSITLLNTTASNTR